MSHQRLIAIIGRVPLPYGGVSVHLERLLGRLHSEYIEYDFYDLGGKSDPKRRIFPGKGDFLWLLWFLLRARWQYRLLHFHSSNPYTLIATNILMAGSGVKLAYTLHGERIFLWVTKAGPWFLRWALRKALRDAHHIFSINPTVAQKLPTLGVAPNRISAMAAYLPPSDQELDPSNLTTDVCNFFLTHRRVIGMQAWFGAFQDGKDIYGLEQIVQLIIGLRDKFPKVGVCTVISGSYDPKHREQIFSLRESAGLVDDWLLHEGGGPAVALFKRCDLFLRPTISDGDSLSVRECLSLGVPVVASDAVVRPQGCCLFPIGDISKMVERVSNILNFINDNPSKNLRYEQKDYALPLLNYYRFFKKNSQL